MSHTVRWGILGPGNIAKKFAQGLADTDGAELVAVASRSKDRAEAFGEKFEVPRRYEGYEKIAADDELDAVYVATPHPMHKDDAVLCIEGGKAVLVEKPFTVNARQARAVIDAARKHGVFCMEAMWSRFLPAVQKAKSLIDDGAIGEVRMVQADFGFRCGGDPASRLMNPELAGGGLLDVGIYPLSLSCMFLGLPDRVTGLAEIGPTGVDDQAGFVLGFPDGPLAICATGVRTSTPHEATVLGTEGRFRMHEGWWRNSPITLHRKGNEAETIELSMVGNGYNYQAEEVGRCLAAGKTESNTMPLDESLALVEVMDELRRQWKLTYPFED